MANTDFDPGAWPMPPSSGQVPPQPPEPPPRINPVQPAPPPPPPPAARPQPGTSAAAIPPVAGGGVPGQPPGPVSWPPFPPATFIPNAPNRDWRTWGKPWWPTEGAKLAPGPAPADHFTPTPHEAYKVMGSSASRLADWGAPSVAGPASQVKMFFAGFAPILDALSRGGFSASFSHANALQVQTQLGRLRIQQEQMLMQAELAHDNQNKLLQQYGELFQMAEVAKNDPQGLKVAEDRISALAGINHDWKMQEMIANYGLKGAASYLQYLDAENRNLGAGHTALTKATEFDKTDAEEQREYGHDEVSVPGTGSPSAGLKFPGLPGRGDEGAHTADAATSDADTTGADTGEPNEFDDLMKKHGFTPEEIEGAHKQYNGTDLGLNKKGTTAARVNRIARGLDTAVNSIAAGPPDDPAGDPENSKIEKIRKVDPETAATLEGLKNYEIDPAAEQLKGGHRANLVRLTKEVFPGYNQGFYKTYQQDWLKGPNQQTMRRANTVATQAVQLVDAINKLPVEENDKHWKTALSELKAQGWTNDPAYASLNAPLRAFATEVVATQAGGRPNVSPVVQFLREVPLTAGKAQFRIMVRQEVIGTSHITEQLNNEFQKESGLDTNAPHYDDHTQAVFSGIARMNPYTGETPQDQATPIELRVAGTTPEQRAKRPSWMTDKMTWTPATKEQMDLMAQWLSNPAHQSDPNYQTVLDKFRAMQ